MYNLTVDEAHTFFVGDGQWLVHNTCAVRGLSGSVIDDPQGQYFVEMAIKYHKALNTNEWITIAYTEKQGQNYVALNGKASYATYLKLKAITDTNRVKLIYEASNLVQDHAEWALFRATSARKIGISNSKGPCPDGCSIKFKEWQLQGLIDNLFYPATKW